MPTINTALICPQRIDIVHDGPRGGENRETAQSPANRRRIRGDRYPEEKSDPFKRDPPFAFFPAEDRRRDGRASGPIARRPARSTSERALPLLSTVSRRCCPVGPPLASRCSCPRRLSVPRSPNSGTDSRTAASRGCWAARPASGSSCRNSARSPAPRAPGSRWCWSRWTVIEATRSPGTWTEWSRRT